MTASKYLKLNLKNKIATSSLGFAVVIFSLLYFIVLPTVNDIKTIGEEIDRQRVDLEKKYIKGQSLRQLTENLKKIEPKLEIIDRIFINANRDLEFVTALENKASVNQISQKIDLASPAAAEVKDFKKTGLSLLTKGGFTNQLKYLMDLESLGYYINVKSLELSSAGERAAGDKNGAAVSMFLVADTYWK